MCAPCKIIINHLYQLMAAFRHKLAELVLQLNAGELTMVDDSDFIYSMIQEEVAGIRSTMEAIKRFGREHGASPRMQAELDKL